MYGGVKYAQLLDFNADGVRELVVLVDRTVQLYTCRDNTAVLLWAGQVGARFGQTDVSYSFRINAMSSTPTVTLFHSENEWTQEAMTVLHINSEGLLIQTELFAQTEEPGDFPDPEQLTGFTINGKSVDETVYDAAVAAAMDGSTGIDVDFGAFPATPEQLDALVTLLRAGSDEQFILPQSDCTLLTEGELRQLTQRQLRLARNEIYARHGRSFSTADLRAYFSAQGWYTEACPAEDFDPRSASVLNRCEVANLNLILSVEESGAYNQEAPDLTQEEARAIAQAYWLGQDGSVDSQTGYLLAISQEQSVALGSRHYYTFRLHALVDNDHWETRDTVYVDMKTGLTHSAIAE